MIVRNLKPVFSISRYR